MHTTCHRSERNQVYVTHFSPRSSYGAVSHGRNTVVQI